MSNVHTHTHAHTHPHAHTEPYWGFQAFISQEGSAAFFDPCEQNQVLSQNMGCEAGNHPVPPSLWEGAVKFAQHFKGAAFCLV